jgi:hypothetical protein
MRPTFGKDQNKGVIKIGRQHNEGFFSPSNAAICQQPKFQGSGEKNIDWCSKMRFSTLSFFLFFGGTVKYMRHISVERGYIENGGGVKGRNSSDGGGAEENEGGMSNK